MVKKLLSPKNFLLTSILDGKHLSYFKYRKTKTYEETVYSTKISYSQYRESLFSEIIREKESDLTKLYLKEYSFLSSKNIDTIEDVILEHGRYIEIMMSSVDTDFIEGIEIEQLVNNDGNNKAIILIDGLPMSKERSRVIKEMFTMGYDTYYSIHPGLMGSGGEFTLNNLKYHYEKLIDSLADKYSSVYIIASSFGGYILSKLENINKVRKIVAFSPAFNLKPIRKIETLDEYVMSITVPSTKIEKENWKKIVSQNVTLEHLIKKKDDLLIVLGNLDKEVSIDYMKEILNPINNPFTIKIFNQEHIGLSKLYLSSYIEILNHFE